WGFDYAVPGPHTLSFSLGLLHIALAIAGAVIAYRGLNHARRFDATIFALAVVAAAYLATTWSSPVWARVAALQYLQFPWRTLGICALFTPLLALYAFERIGARGTLLLVLLIMMLNLRHTQPKGYLNYDD